MWAFCHPGLSPLPSCNSWSSFSVKRSQAPGLQFEVDLSELQAEYILQQGSLPIRWEEYYHGREGWWGVGKVRPQGLTLGMRAVVWACSPILPKSLPCSETWLSKLYEELAGPCPQHFFKRVEGVAYTAHPPNPGLRPACVSVTSADAK